jgi:hypothetical protein
MKAVLALTTLGLAIVFTAPAFAQTTDAPKTKAECAKQKDMKWDEAGKKCAKK